jgi:AraC-like DNA-binding protein
MAAMRYSFSMKKKAVFYGAGERGVYVGRLENRFKRTNVPSTLLVSLEDELEVRDPMHRDRAVGKSFLIPAGMNLEVDTHGANVVMFFLGGNQDHYRLTALMQSMFPMGGQPCFSGIRGESEVVEFANMLRNQRPPLATVEHMVSEWMNHPLRRRPEPDPRIVQAIHLIRQSHDQNFSVEWIARKVGLSASRLGELFKEVVGTPIRRFRLWHRFFVTAARLNEGAPFTDAALAAGFADYAQFSRTYRQLAGGNPSQARANTEILLRDF